MPTSQLIFFGVIFLSGTLTSLTDLRHRKIYNIHLLIGAILGIGTVIYSQFWFNESIAPHFLNGLIAFVIGFVCYHFGLWKGGDAKLYTLLAFLMPPVIKEYTVLPEAGLLFICSFIVSTAILIPVLVKDMASNYKAAIKSIDIKELIIVSRTTMYVSWGLFPLYHFAIIALKWHVHSAIVSLVITYGIFYLTDRFIKKIEANYIIYILVIASGLFMRFWLTPQPISWADLAISTSRILFFILLSAYIQFINKHIKKYKDRIPFAPMLLIGCILSYTPFILWVTRLLNFSNR